MRMVAATRSKKTPTNVSVRAHLVARAKELGLNLSALLEAALEQAIRDADRAKWQAESKEAIDHYNARIRKNGLFSDRYRKF
jgi:antitoxin CcdA